MIKGILLGLLGVFGSVHSMEESTETIHRLTYTEPTGAHWAVEKQEYINVSFINWSSTKSPKKEFSIAVEQSETLDVHSESFLQELKQRLPPKAVFSIPSFTDKLGQESLFINFTLTSDNSILYGQTIAAYADGFLYEIIISRYYEPIEDDKELTHLINSIKIQLEKKIQP